MKSFPFSPASFSQTGSVIACVDRVPHASNIARSAAFLAALLDRPLTLYHVIETGAEPWVRHDPIEWNLQRHQANDFLKQLVGKLDLPHDEVTIEVGEGDRTRSICGIASERNAILVMGASTGDEHLLFSDHTEQHVLESGVGSVLLVPKGQQVSNTAIGRIVVPLDGSCFSEAALAEATRLAARTGAEMVLAHVVPEADLVSYGPLESSDIELRGMLNRRNENAATHFLERTQRRILDQGLKVRAKFLKGDTRSSLQRAIEEEEPALVVLSARGQGWHRCRDLAIGSTARYLLDHLDGPTLVVPAVSRLAERPVMPTPDLRPPTSRCAA
jgi:nucleotide-binding universal stress UspA family protein